MIPSDSIPRSRLGLGFSVVLRRHAASDAYRSLAAHVQGFPGPGFGLLDAEQLDRLRTALQASPGDRVADLGCGLGLLGERLAQEIPGIAPGFVGVDLALGALDAARRRVGSHWTAADLSSLPFASARLDRLVAVDSLYFLPDPDLDRAVAEAARVLVPAGRLVALASELLPRGAERPPERTRLGRALDDAGFAWTAHDLTDLEHAFWRRRAAELPRLEAAFAEEGNRDLWQALAEETERGVTWSREGRVRRYLFRAVRPAGPGGAAPGADEPGPRGSR